jgi:hypothetical protein
MKTNVGTIDRIIRVILGLGLLFKNWLGLIGIVPLLTAFVGFCPAYLPFGLSTCAKPDSAKK